MLGILFTTTTTLSVSCTEHNVHVSVYYTAALCTTHQPIWDSAALWLDSVKPLININYNWLISLLFVLVQKLALAVMTLFVCFTHNTVHYGIHLALTTETLCQCLLPSWLILTEFDHIQLMHDSFTNKCFYTRCFNHTWKRKIKLQPYWVPRNKTF